MSGFTPATWNEKVLTPLFIHARMEFLNAQYAKFATPRASDFAHFLTWAIQQAKDNPEPGAVIPSEFTTYAPSTVNRLLAEEPHEGGDVPSPNSGPALYAAPPLSSLMATYLAFDHLSEVVHAKKESQAEIEELSFDERASLLTERRLPQIVGMCYKWAKLLVRHKVPSGEFDIRAAQMFFLFGELCNVKVATFCAGTLRMPRKILKEYLQVEQMSETSANFESFLYTYALCHQQETKFIRPQQVKLAKGKDWGLITTGKIVTIIYKAWNCFAQYLGFNSLSAMVHPFMLIDKATGKMHLVPDLLSVLPDCHRLELCFRLEAESAQSHQGKIGVLKDSQEAPLVFRAMSEEALKHVRTFTKDLFNDVESLVTNRDVFEGFNGSTSDLLSMFVFQRGCLSSRFEYYSQFTTSLVRSAVSAGKDDQAAGGIPIPVALHVNMETDPLESPTEALTERHVCPHGCDCPDLRRVIADEMTERYCAIVHSDFREISEAFEEGVIQVTPQSVQLILTDPPSCIEDWQQPRRSSRNSLDGKAYADFANLVFEMLRPGGHLILFCSALQFSKWYSMFTNFKLPGKSGESAFAVDEEPLIMISGDRHPLRDANYEEVVHHSIVQYGLHVVRRQDGRCNPTEMVQWKNHGHIFSNCAAYTNVIDNVPSVGSLERLRWSAADGLSASAPCVPVVQKSVSLFRELVCRYSKPYDSVLDPFAGSFTTAIACLTVQIPRMFYGADVDQNCVLAGAERCMYTFTKRVVNTPADDPHALRVSSRLRDKMAVIYNRLFRAIDEKRPLRSMLTDSVALPDGDMPFIQLLPSSMRVHLASLTRDSSFTEGFFERNGPDKWPVEAYAALSRADIEGLQTAECARYFLMRSDLHYLTAARPKQVNDLLGYYYGIIVYVDLAQVSGGSVTYGGGIHTVSRDKYARHRISVLQKDEHVMYNDLQLSNVYIAPAPYCPFHRVRLSREEEESNAGLFVKHATAFTAILQPTHISVRATKHIEPGQPIVVKVPPVYETSLKK